MWFCAACFYFFQFILRASPSVIANDLMQGLAIDSFALGLLVSYYYYGYSFMQIPSGLILDRVGPRRPLTVATLICAMGALSFYLFSSLWMLALGRLLMGIGSSVGFICCVHIASKVFPRQKLSMFISLTLLMGTLGATTAGKPFALLVDLLDWRLVHALLAGLSLLLCVVIWFSIPEGPDLGQKPDKPGVKEKPSAPVLRSMALVLQNSQTWIYGLFAFCMYVPICGVADLWGVPYLMEAYGVNRQTASVANSMMYLGMGLGGPLWSLYVEKCQSYLKPLRMGCFCTLALVMVFIFCPSLPFFMYYIILFAMGACATSQFISYAGITEMNANHRTGVALGIQNMFCTISGVLIQPLLGYILRQFWNGAYRCGAPHYSAESFQKALLVLPVCGLLAFIMLFFVTENFPRTSKVKKT